MSDHPIKKPQSGTADVDPGARDVKKTDQGRDILVDPKILNQCQFCKRILSSKQKLEEHRIIHEHFGHGRSPKKTPKKTLKKFQERSLQE